MEENRLYRQHPHCFESSLVACAVTTTTRAMELTHYGGYRLQPRINLGREVTPIPPDSTDKPPTGVFHRLFARSSEDKCKETPDSNTCEKPVGGNLTVPIVVVIVYAINYTFLSSAVGELEE